MTANNSDNFLFQFKAIGQSLKKRFFRKPNVSDAIDQYESLCKQLLHSNQKEFAAICSLEQAKCYESVQNSVGQASSLSRGSAYMIDAFKEYNSFELGRPDMAYGDKMGGRGDGLVQTAVQALEQCIKSHNGLENYGLVLLINMKIGDILSSNNYFDQALRYYEEALKIAQKRFTLPDQLVIIEKVVKCKIKISELESASQLVADYLDKAKRASSNVAATELFSSFVTKFEITRVCLLLLLGCDAIDMVAFIWPEEPSEDDDNSSTSPTPENVSPDQLEGLDDNNSMKKTVLVYLKSLALAVQHGSVSEIHIVHNHLNPFMDETHQELFRILVQLQS